MIAWANETRLSRLFGHHGDTGRNKRPGQDGQAGHATNATAADNPARFILSGHGEKDGEAGARG